MSFFENLAPNEYVFNFDVKEEPVLCATSTDVFRNMPKDYLLFGEMKYHSLFCNDQEANMDEQRYFETSFQ